jgi:N-acetylglucosamine-6-sulfatase
VRSIPKAFALTVVCLVFGLASISCRSETNFEGSATATPDPSDRPNIILILADDLDAGSISYMPELKSLLIELGTSFENAFVTYPACCPSRASILRGQYPHNHQVLSNKLPLGGFEKFRDLGHESSTIATWLQSGGYGTVLIGKYLNGYPLGVEPTYAPLGWDEWYGYLGDNFVWNSQDFGYDYFNYRMNENGEVVSYGHDTEDYLTDVLQAKPPITSGGRQKTISPSSCIWHRSYPTNR